MFVQPALAVQKRTQSRVSSGRYVKPAHAALKSSSPPHSSLHANDARFLNTLGNPLGSAELKLLQSFYKSHVEAADEELWNPLLVQKAVLSLNDLKDISTLEGAMLALEQVYLTQRSPDATQDTISYLHGTWRMTFATGGFPRQQVVPVPEFFQIIPEGQRIEVKTLLGPLTPVFFGAYEWDPEQRLLLYGFNEGSLTVANTFTMRFPFSFTNREATFFFIGEQHACARSGKDGVILFERESSGA